MPPSANRVAPTTADTVSKREMYPDAVGAVLARTVVVPVPNLDRPDAVDPARPRQARQA